MHAPAILDSDMNPTIALEEVAPEAFTLVERFYRANGYKLHCGRYERVFVVRINSEIIAAARLLPRQGNSYWLRNMLVTNEQRNTGVGTYLMREVLRQIAPDNCYCFALPQVVGFYQRLGFVIGTPDLCPPDIADAYRKYKSRGRDWVLMFTKSP